MSAIEAFAAGGGLVAASAGMWWLRSLGAGAPVQTGSAAVVASAPLELRTAVFVFAEIQQRAHMWKALRLGSIETGFPPIEDWVYTDHGLRVDLLMLAGQSSADWNSETACDAMAAILAVPEITVSFPHPGGVRLDLRVFDTLSAPVALPPVGTLGSVDLEAVPVGVTEAHDVWRLRVLYGHILLAGATGAGKGSVLWSILAGIGPAIRDGLVDVLMADPKGGAEFGRGEDRLFTRFATDTTTILALLREAVETLRDRLAHMRSAGVRKHIPTVDEPLILIIIDEAASLSAYAEREDQIEFKRLMGVLLSQGRAAAVSVIAALQDPSKETMPVRQLFPVRIGLRLDEPTQVAMVHGQGARARGARCDKISTDTPGVGYVGEDGSTEFVRVRAFWVCDDTADAIVDAYSPAPAIPSGSSDPEFDPTTFDPDDLGDESAAAA
ncbi:FtsK/SpoIIIE domain-containing protein [Nocardia sp. NPDC049220]|uniref:FtsK/SpoIIIE domain-containing protein n=1 Tax=Nocardia sp. NPDC049220 TaxID=3155273 RepID=UPI003408AF4D